MISTIVKPGDRIELIKINNEEKFTENEKKRTYFSKICDIIEEDKLKIVMPTEGTKMIVAGLNTQYELCLFSGGSLYKCRGTIIERYKEDNIYVAIIELYTGVQKFQRRQHYRLECNQELQYQLLSEAEARTLLNMKEPRLVQNALLSQGRIKGITLDISGGGIRFVSPYPTDEEAYVLLEFDLKLQQERRPFNIVAKVIQTRKIPNRDKTYEHRVQFTSIEEQAREDLIKFIFEEERRHRKNEKG